MMIISFSKAFLASLALLAMTTFSSAHANAVLGDNGVMMASTAARVDEIRASVLGSNEKYHQERRRRRLTQDLGFGDVCDVFESDYDEDFDCSCDEATSTLVCATRVCEFGECATVSVEMDFTPDFVFDYMKICIKYEGDAAEDYPDICIRVDVDAFGNLESCKVELEKDGRLQECKECGACSANGFDGMILDCSNLYPDATTGGCSTGDVQSSQSGNPGRIVQQRAASDMENGNTGGNGGGSAAASYGMIPVGVALGLVGIMQGLM